MLTFERCPSEILEQLRYDPQAYPLPIQQLRLQSQFSQIAIWDERNSCSVSKKQLE